jgi:archaellum component FlaC
LPYKNEAVINETDEIEVLRKSNRCLRKKLAQMEISFDNKERLLREDRARMVERMRGMEETFDREIVGHEKVRKYAQSELEKNEKRMIRMKKEMQSINRAYNSLDESYEHTIESFKDDISRLQDKLNVANLKLKNIRATLYEEYKGLLLETMKEYYEDLRVCEEELYHLVSICKKCIICSKVHG